MTPKKRNPHQKIFLLEKNMCQSLYYTLHRERKNTNCKRVAENWLCRMTGDYYFSSSFKIEGFVRLLCTFVHTEVWKADGLAIKKSTIRRRRRDEKNHFGSSLLVLKRQAVGSLLLLAYISRCPILETSLGLDGLHLHLPLPLFHLRRLILGAATTLLRKLIQGSKKSITHSVFTMGAKGQLLSKLKPVSIWRWIHWNEMSFWHPVFCF